MKKLALALVAAVSLLAAVPASAQMDRGMRADGVANTLLDSNAQMMMRRDRRMGMRERMRRPMMMKRNMYRGRPMRRGMRPGMMMR